MDIVIFFTSFPPPCGIILSVLFTPSVVSGGDGMVDDAGGTDGDSAVLTFVVVVAVFKMLRLPRRCHRCF